MQGEGKVLIRSHVIEASGSGKLGMYLLGVSRCGLAWESASWTR